MQSAKGGGKKGQIKSNKVIQLIIIWMESSEITAGPKKGWKKGVREDKCGGRLLVPHPQVRVKEPPAKFSFARLLLFFMGHPECKKYDLPLWCSNRNEAIKL